MKISSPPTQHCLPVISLNKIKQGMTHLHFFDKEVVIAKHGNDYFMYPSICPHRGTPLRHAKKTENSLECPYHGWKIHPNGSVINPHLQKESCQIKVTKLHAAEGMLWLNTKNRPLPVISDSTLSHCGSLSFLLEAPLHIVLDNFNEGSHTPFVHHHLGPNPQQVAATKFEWSQEDEQVNIHYYGKQRSNLLLTLFFGSSNLSWDISWKTRFDPLRMTYVSYWKDTKNQKIRSPQNTNIYFLIPAGDHKTYLHAIIYTEIKPHLRWVSPLVKYFSQYFTARQVKEDAVFYPKIKNISAHFKSSAIDIFDEPLEPIRRKTEKFFLGGMDV